jgi:ABC-type antimicrobial peptide transport system permease subunit
LKRSFDSDTAFRGDAPSDFSIENPADVLTARSAAAHILNMLLTAVASVSLIVGGISIMNFTYRYRRYQRYSLAIPC